ncbi:hypothetical protein CP966_10120 [Streptomyces galilaeus]|uniref:DUF6215 domain-containing protein n=1 Tax=Streptomyces galilaeus TaxID=33899 RepID=UPI00123CA68E|nr:DUF6215 domain-containing protein [Streptomyces galilaeus]QEU65599.1 hypothetical protein CP966_10120 [Streptomyces galilaeus]GGW74024.1 hypothetical protein GCM10010350_68440 [Streptomyces galilaeus]
MLGLLLRVLPFWVREPLLIVVGAVFGARITYLAVHDQNRVAAVIGAVFLVFTAIRVRLVVRALRARRNPVPAASADGAPTDAVARAWAQAQLAAPAPAPGPAPAGAGLPPGPVTAGKEPNPWGQAVAAVAVFAAIAAAVWLGPDVLPADNDTSTSRAASCSDTEDEELPAVYGKAPRPVTGAELCEALNRPDLARLLGTPTETATSASGTSNTAALTDGKVAQPEAEVRFDTYTVNLSATYNELSTAQYVNLLKIAGTEGEKDLRTLTVLGRPALLSSDPTMKIEISLGDEGSSGPVQQGPLARTLSVALDSKDRGGSYDITVWSESGALPDDGVLLGIAEKILPTIPLRSVR